MVWIRKTFLVLLFFIITMGLSSRQSWAVVPYPVTEEPISEHQVVESQLKNLTEKLRAYVRLQDQDLEKIRSEVRQIIERDILMSRDNVLWRCGSIVFSLFLFILFLKILLSSV